MSAIRVPRLREYRDRALLTQEELGQRASVSTATINRIEMGHTAPYPSTVRKLARALRVSPRALMDDGGVVREAHS